ncbi:MAG TPA: YceI family protein [Candidatus Dormibacteraeota bacterium]|nr:YceI family protein [Candidatus Dormibacteraeota bacterium]
MVQYEVDQQHTHVGFTAKHLGVSTVRGRFNKFEGHFEGRDDDFTKARGEVKIEVASLDSRSDQRDTHLRSADFFDAEKYPYITFKITKVEAIDAESLRVSGDLTIKDVTKPIVLEATIEGRMPDPFGAKERVGISARGQIDRMEFGLNWNGVAGVVPFASHTIKLEVDAEIVVKAAELAQAS